MPDLTELDRLIEEGLTLYGQGDLDGALLMWERALAVDPDNAQANSYVDYVRMNYEMLTTDAGQDDAAPFGIAEDEPEYQIEIMPGEVGPEPPPPMYMDPRDEGWFMEREPERSGLNQLPLRPSDENLEVTYDLEAQVTTLELDADEPPLPEPKEREVSFEDATREYEPSEAQRQAKLAREVDPEPPEPATMEFQPEGTPGFETQSALNTAIKKRELGFVKATDPPTPDPDELPPAPPLRVRGPSASPPELKMTLRTPAPDDDSADDEPQVSVSYNAPDPEDDLIDSLPSPRPAHTTRDLPSSIVPPAAPVRVSIESFELGEPDLPPEVSVSFATKAAVAAAEEPEPESAPEPAPTPKPEPEPAAEPLPLLSSAPTRDFSDKPTQEINQRPPEIDPEINVSVSAPTRELGLRPPGTGGKRALTEDEPTGAKPPLDPAKILGAEGGTRADIVLPFDPIDARTQKILEEVDQGAPAEEAKDDRTRRRISALLEHAAEWSKGTDLDRAVAAVDLALSEDPNSALAQKLIHRNRDTIMLVFQNFLGDLNRQPILARPLHELGGSPISPRAAFLLSRIDGTLSLDEILDVSGMPRLEAFRYLCQLFLRGILQ